MRLRVHHLLCSSLFVGKGYSEDFVKNMSAVTEKLFPNNAPTEAESIILVTQPDQICRDCPNLQNGKCMLDQNEVVSKDEQLARAMQLIPGKEYTQIQLYEKVLHGLSRDTFEKSCLNCRWYKQGLCSYEKILVKYRSFLNAQMKTNEA